MNIFLCLYDPEAEENRWHRAAGSNEIQEFATTKVVVGGRDIILTRVDGSVCAVDGQCPHRGTPLDKGGIRDGNIRCPMHGYEFDLKTGKGVGNDEILETIRVLESKDPP